jgi:acyl-CoA reductase-like NAD-dependent aldehyde dehydrogenase
MAKEYKLLIGGERVKTSTPLPVNNPADGSLVGMSWLAGPGELDAAVGAAASSFDGLRRMPSFKKAEAIARVSAGIGERAEELARTLALEAGKPIKDARTEVSRTQSTFRIASEEATRLGGEVLPLDISPGSEGRFGIVRRFPVGTVLGISPFNFPLNLVAHKVAPAMACGNPIVLKPAEKTPLSALILGEIITDAGWPAGGVNVVPATGIETQKLLGDDRIKKLSFTGSAAVGWKIKERAGSRRVTLELGGNAGVIVHEDADLERAASRCTTGAFAYAGQVCISVQRIYVQRSVFKRFTELFVDAVGRLKVGDPLDETTDVGPMINEAAAIRTEEWVGEAIRGGAELMAGGKRDKSFFEPTVISGTTPEMKVCSSELFAPVVVLEPYDSFEAAVELVNSGEFGLQAGVFTRDMSRILYAYEQLEVGGVIAGDIPTYRVDNMPYGGVKQSGFGREGVKYAIEEMTELKLLAFNPS